jgi:acetone carboxylase gamma subunit
MNFSNYKLKNPIQKIMNITQYNINFSNFILNKSVTIQVNVFDDTNTVINQFSFILEGDEYNNWGNNDDYITNLIEKKIHDLYPQSMVNATGPTGFICFTEENESMENTGDTGFTGFTGPIEDSL